MKEVGAPKYVEGSKDELVVLDMVSRLIKYGDISDKAMSYLKVLLGRIENAPAIAAARAAEAAAAKPVPAFSGRAVIEGEVLSVKKVEGPFGYAEKALIKHSDGWKLYGNLPGALHGSVERGDKLRFVASVKVSDNDPSLRVLVAACQGRGLQERGGRGVTISDDAFFEKFDPVLSLVLKSAGRDIILRQRLIEALLSWHAYDVAAGDEFRAVFVIDSAAKHAKQFMTGPSMIIEQGKKK